MPSALLALLLVSCSTTVAASDKDPAPLPSAGPGQAAAVFAGGCFWCLESDFDKLPGIVATTSGYIGGKTERPTYELVNTHTTGHTEAVHVVYDTSKLSYDQVVDYFFRHVDPTDAGGQFCDRGDTYRTGVFPLDEAQKKAAEAGKAKAQAALGKPVVTEVTLAGTFWPAEVYHQDYHTKNAAHYERYRRGCGRDRKVAELWTGR